MANTDELTTLLQSISTTVYNLVSSTEGTLPPTVDASGETNPFTGAPLLSGQSNSASLTGFTPPDYGPYMP
tara:strand:- start:189 stop:401 length:213 start_codon:yes stop_codon:yes gene_type:complete